MRRSRGYRSLRTFHRLHCDRADWESDRSPVTFATSSKQGTDQVASFGKLLHCRPTHQQDIEVPIAIVIEDAHPPPIVSTMCCLDELPWTFLKPAQLRG